MLGYGTESDRVVAQMNAAWAGELEARRMRAFESRYKLMTGDFRDLVRSQLRAAFSKPEVADRISLLANQSVNTFRFVTEEIYSYPGARRCFRRKDGKEDPVYARLAKDVVPFDFWMREVSLALGAYNDCLIRIFHGRVGKDGKAGVPSVRVFLPHEVAVPKTDQDDPGTPLEVRYQALDPAGNPYVIVWTAESHYQEGVDTSVRRPVEGSQGLRNPYGFLPFVAVHAGLRGDCFWDELTGEDRFWFALDYLVQWSSIDFLMLQQNYRQLVRKLSPNVRGNPPPFAYIGPGTELQLAPGEEVVALDMQADPRAQKEVLREELSAHLAEFGLNAEELAKNPGQAPPSGLARMIQRQKIIDRRKNVRPFLIEAEYEIAGLFRQMWNLGHPDELIDEEATFEVEILEEPFLESPLEREQARTVQLANWQMERTLGLRSRVEQIAEDREIELEEAATVAAEIDAGAAAAETDQNAGASPDGTEPDQTSGQVED